MFGSSASARSPLRERDTAAFAFVSGQTLGTVSNTATARPAFCRFAWPSASSGQSPGHVFHFTIRLRCRQICYLQRRRRGAANHSILPCAGPALSSSVTFAAKIQPAAQGFWWQLFGANFHEKVFSNMAASYLFRLHIGSQGLHGTHSFCNGFGRVRIRRM